VLLIDVVARRNRVLAEPGPAEFALQHIGNDLPSRALTGTQELPSEVGDVFPSNQESQNFAHENAVESRALRIHETQQGDFVALLEKCSGHFYRHDSSNTLAKEVIGASRLKGAKLHQVFVSHLGDRRVPG
jgi:hypothetical protein